MPDLRLVLFIDAQNTYRCARESFFGPGDFHTYGQFDPIKLGQLIAGRGGPSGAGVELQQVRVYTGRPDSSRDPRSYGAHMKQCSAWTRSGVEVIWRTLRYPPPGTAERPQEKGIDVALAVDFVAMAADGAYDIGVIFSTDTDLVPPLEYVAKRFPSQRYPAVAAWRSNTGNRRLFSRQVNLWCHYLDRADYEIVADLTDYNR